MDNPDTTAERNAKGPVADSAAAPAGTPGPVRGSDWDVPGVELRLVWLPSLSIWTGRYPVTNAEYRCVVPDHSSGAYRGHSMDGDRRPVVQVSFGDACAYADWLTEREASAGRLPSGFAYRLPTAVEWTAFCRCGDGRRYPWGENWPPTQGNYADVQARLCGWSVIEGYDDGYPVTCPVESSGENAWGLFGVGGNVWEWTLEGEGSSRVVRGAAWLCSHPDVLRCSYRRFCLPPTRDHSIGFRLVLAEQVEIKPLSPMHARPADGRY